MLKKFLLFTIASLVVLPALADKPLDKGNKGGGAVPLIVTFEDDDCGVSGEGNPRFCSDEFIVYADGVGPVTTQIDKFRFGLNVGLDGFRNFFLDLTGCVSEPPSCSPPFQTGLTIGWNVFSASPDGAQYLSMPDGYNIPVNFTLDFFDALDREWRIQFNPSECPQSTMAKVTKISAGWEFEADKNAVACLSLRGKGRKHRTYHGLYILPFKITAVEQ